MKNVVKIVVEKPRSSCGWEDKFKLDLRDKECEGEDCIEMAQDRVHWHDIEKIWVL
jgi:hypothetical protein